MAVESQASQNPTVFSVGDLAGITYTRNFLSREQQDALLELILSSKQPWTCVSSRKLQNHGGAVVGCVLVPAPLPGWLEPWLARIQAHCRKTGLDKCTTPNWQPNHVLINAYECGQGIMPHQDGPAYAPLVAILSLGAPRILRFYPHRGREEGIVRGPDDGNSPPTAAKPRASFILEPGSLVTFADSAFHSFLHGIDAVDMETVDASVCNAAACGLQVGAVLPQGHRRVSLTVRQVIQTRPIIVGNRHNRERAQG